MFTLRFIIKHIPLQGVIWYVQQKVVKFYHAPAPIKL